MKSMSVYDYSKLVQDVNLPISVRRRLFSKLNFLHDAWFVRDLESWHNVKTSIDSMLETLYLVGVLPDTSLWSTFVWVDYFFNDLWEV